MPKNSQEHASEKGAQISQEKYEELKSVTSYSSDEPVAYRELKRRKALEIGKELLGISNLGTKTKNETKGIIENLNSQPRYSTDEEKMIRKEDRDEVIQKAFDEFEKRFLEINKKYDSKEDFERVWDLWHPVDPDRHPKGIPPKNREELKERRKWDKKRALDELFRQIGKVQSWVGDELRPTVAAIYQQLKKERTIESRVKQGTEELQEQHEREERLSELKKYLDIPDEKPSRRTLH